jgi:hypothetical protein
VVLLGYGFFPLSVLALERFMETPSGKRFLTFAFVFALYPLVSLHWAYIAAGFLFLYALVSVAQKQLWKKLVTPDAFKKYLTLAGIFLLVNSFWIFGFFEAGETFSRITLEDFKAFATLADPRLGVWFNVLSLYGIWAQDFLFPKDLFSGWPLVSAAVLALFLLGAWRAGRGKNALALTVIAGFIPTLLLATGYGSALTRPLIDWLFYHLPFFGGLRDTAKLTGLLAFSYALLVPVGLSVVMEYFFRRVRCKNEKLPSMLAAGISMLLVFLWAGALLGGAHGQLNAYSYPADWYAAEEFLRADPVAGKALFLPWHAYLKLNFADNAMAANPARVFFSSPMISGKDTSNRHLALAEETPWDTHVALLTAVPISDDREFWRREGVSHIVLAKTDDWRQFAGLYQSAYFEVVFEGEAIAVFRIR